MLVRASLPPLLRMLHGLQRRLPSWLPRLWQLSWLHANGPVRLFANTQRSFKVWCRDWLPQRSYLPHAHWRAGREGRAEGARKQQTGEPQSMR